MPTHLLTKVCLSLVLLIFSGGLPADTHGPIRISIVLSADDPIQHTIASSIEQNLRRRPGDNFNYERVIAGPAAVDAWHASAGKPHYIVTLGGAALKQSLRWENGTPMVHGLIAQESLDAFAKDSQLPSSSHAGHTTVLLDQPVDRQLRIIRLLLPNARTVGIALGPGSFHQLPAFKAAAQTLGLEVEARKVEDEQAFVWAVKDLSRHSDVLLVVPDSRVLTARSAKWLLYISYSQDTPVIGFSAALAKAGALAAVFSSPDDVSRDIYEQLSAIIDARARGDRDSASPASTKDPKHFSLKINHAVARSFGMTNVDIERITNILNQPENDNDGQTVP